ncbi:MAG: Rrf2 family transcriptional regulator, partial [Candidatus Lokiarchaeota archaeon]|nr:Rrf2 family transcriptional regulator [Candidatus Lokiarchaeota archaeon]
YIDDQYNVTEVKSFFGESPSLPELRGTSETGEVRIPIVVKEVPKMSVDLGMVTAEEYKIMKICDGMNTIEKVAQIASTSVDYIEKIMEKLHKKGLIKVIKRT